VGLNIELPHEQHLNSQHRAPLLDWIDTALEDEGTISAADKSSSSLPIRRTKSAPAS